MFACYYGNLDSAEFLAASDAVAQYVDKKGRSCLHYAAINDNAQLIETLFLHFKANPNPVRPTTDFAPDVPTASADREDADNLGNLDERY